MLSAWSGNAKTSPDPDIMAMQAIQTTFYELKDGMPDRYNAGGTLMGLIKNGADFVSKFLGGNESKPEKTRRAPAAQQKRTPRKQVTTKTAAAPQVTKPKQGKLNGGKKQVGRSIAAVEKEIATLHKELRELRLAHTPNPNKKRKGPKFVDATEYA